ncbi:MAG TPA: c-type cytochrome [Paracoccaceae bacterium]|jgi:cytochrome c oxidase cbb3-type subunit 3|nr:c-type cytochrome [Paracoccaceae bacterium]
MSSRFRNSLAALALVALICGCDREERNPRGAPLGETIPMGASPNTIFPGQSQPPPLDPRAAAYEGNAYAIAQGQQLFTMMNCVGCHSHGGGGMGPALIDGKWKYGGRIDQIAATIYQGRPYGMPSWRGKLTNQQIWQLAAYVRSLSGQVRKDAVGARADAMSSTPPQTETIRKPVEPADSGGQ